MRSLPSATKAASCCAPEDEFVPAADETRPGHLSSLETLCKHSRPIPFFSECPVTRGPRTVCHTHVRANGTRPICIEGDDGCRHSMSRPSGDETPPREVRPQAPHSCLWRRNTRYGSTTISPRHVCGGLTSAQHPQPVPRMPNKDQRSHGRLTSTHERILEWNRVPTIHERMPSGKG